MPSTLSAPVTITDEQKRQYVNEGYFILEAVLPQEHLEILRGEAQNFIDKIHADMDRQGKDVIGINHRNKRYFISNRYKESPRLREVIFSNLMAEICRATLGPTAYLFFEQYVIKAAEVGMKFAWHQDSGYVGHPHRTYLTTWIALDDMTIENGTIYVLPYSRAGTKDRIEHVAEAGTNDLVGYHGDDPGIPVIVPAGSIAVFSSTCFHRSGANTTSKMRRVYLPQYSAEPIMTKDGTKPWALAEPFLENGQRVGQ
jgi:ectoine hydroxylase-related dioxygenase (phytanoyl-CoA dioxygenase family)